MIPRISNGSSRVDTASRALSGAGYWITGLFLIMVLVDLILVYRHESAGQLGITMLCWMAVWVIARQNAAFSIGARPGWAGLIVGILLFGTLVWAILRPRESWTQLLALYPIWAGAALVLVSGGVLGLIHHWRELLILFFLGIPHGFLLGLIDLSTTTARFSAFLLHYGGREVLLTGREIALPGGAVEVVKSCDGTGAMAYLACLGVIFLVLFPATVWQRVILVPVGMSIAFVTNGVRVALLAVIESSAGAHAFDYWHTGSGAMLWTGLPVMLFGLLCFALLHYRHPPDAVEVDAPAPVSGS